MIEFAENTSITSQELSDLFRASGIRRPIDDHERLAQMIENADLTICAFDDTKLIGVARAVTDFSFCCYLSDLAVDEEYQGRGIGRELVARVRARIGPKCNLVLLSAPDAMEYYPKLGFERAAHCWMFKRVE